MGWKAADDSGTGDTPGQDPGPARPLAGFGHGGPWDAAAPSAPLAAALEQAAGPEGLYDGADTDALVGIARQWAAVESWAAAGKLAALRAMMREDGDGRPLLRRRHDLPEGWDDSLTYEISGALAMGPVSAGNLARLAWTLGTRLAGIGRLLAGGTLTLPKARLVAQTFEPLDEGEAARAEALVLGELPGKTYPQVERLAWRAALAVAPDVAERRRKAAERHAPGSRCSARSPARPACPAATCPPPRPSPGTPTCWPAPGSTRRRGRSAARPTAPCRPWPTSTCSAGSAPATRIAFARTAPNRGTARRRQTATATAATTSGDPRHGGSAGDPAAAARTTPERRRPRRGRQADGDTGPARTARRRRPGQRRRRQAADRRRRHPERDPGEPGDGGDRAGRRPGQHGARQRVGAGWRRRRARRSRRQRPRRCPR